jgi:hypothetical protein
MPAAAKTTRNFFIVAIPAIEFNGIEPGFASTCDHLPEL